MSRSGGSTYKRCGCRDQRTGRQLGRRCPRLGDRGHGSWYLAIEVPAAPDGHRSRVRLGGYATRSAAQAALRGLRAPGGRPGRGTAGCTTGQWLAAWLAGKQSLRPSARRSYQHHLDTYLIPRIGGIPLAMLTAADLRVMFNAIGRQRPAAGAPLSAATLARIRATLRAALNAAIREGMITANPARLVELPPPARPHPVVWTLPREAAWRETGTRPAVAVWTAEQTARFLAAIRGDPLYPCYQLMAVSGLRRGEAAAVRWCDIDFAGATLTVRRQLQETGRGLIVLPPKGVASNRVLALDAWTVQVLAGHRDRQPPAPAEGYVFARPGGRHYPPGYLTRRFIRLVCREDLPPIRLHDLRHGAATLALAGGADLKMIQAMLGHASIVLTADTYTSVLPDVARATAQAVAAQIMKAARTPPALTTASPWPHAPAA
ncbi:MAG: site-specific integrase [Actinobacteria bacterium]|nr:site-specific integrase [Actinomycetota bacterium]